MVPEVQSLVVAQTWDGSPASSSDWVKVELALTSTALIVEVDAPFHGDPVPASPAGPTPGLWNYEVVELFLLGDEEQYLEVELGPHGHYLVLELSGRRRVVREHTELDYRAELRGERFVGRAEVPLHWLPLGVARINAYAIHGASDARQYLAWRGAPGHKPDFHRLETFGTLGLPGLSAEVRVPSARAARARVRGRA